MPRLHVWLIGAATAATTSYVGYSRVYLPRVTSQRQFESKLVMDKEPVQHVMQFYAQLQATIDEAKTRAAILHAERGSGHHQRRRQKIRSTPAVEQAEEDEVDYATLIGGGVLPPTTTTAPSPSPAPKRPPEVVGDGGTMPGKAAADHGDTGDDARDKSNRSSDNLPHHDEQIFFTNREKLLLFLRIQRLRYLVYRLPLTAQQTERDLQALLTHLDAMEQRYCCTGLGRVVVNTPASEETPPAAATPARATTGAITLATVPAEHGLLNFRDTPLTPSQRQVSAACYLLYVVCFRALPYLLSWVPTTLAAAVLYGPNALSLIRDGAARHHRDIEALCVEDANLGGEDPLVLEWLVAYRLHSLYHAVAKFILECLDVDVTMTCEDRRALTAVYRSPQRPGGAGTGSASRDDSPAFVVMNPAHWIEEVGFWGCAQNPLLLPPPHPAVAVDAAAGEALEWEATRHPMRVLSAPPTTFLAGLFTARREDRLWWRGTTLSADEDVAAAPDRGVVSRLFSWRPHACAFPVDYAVLWRQEQREKDDRVEAEWQRMRELDTLIRGRGGAGAGDADNNATADGPSTTPWSSPSAAAAAPFAPAHGRSSLGYPLAVDAAALASYVQRAAAADDDDDGHMSNSTAPPLVPVAVAGLPRVLFIGGSGGSGGQSSVVAKEDSRPRRSSAAVYGYLASSQFAHAPATNNNNNSDDGDSGSGRGATTTTMADATAVARALTQLQQQRGFPLHAPEWWCNVFGGATRGGRRTRRSLHVHMGRPSYPEEVVAAMLDATERAVEAAYAEG